MWRTSNGDRILQPKEKILFFTGVASLLTALQTSIREKEDYRADASPYGRLPPKQKIMVLADVAKALTDKAVPCPEHTAISEGAIGAVYAELHALTSVCQRSKKAQKTWDVFTQLRDAAQEAGCGMEFDLEHLATDRDERGELIECLADRILWDRDFEEDSILDLPRKRAKVVKALMRINDHYYETAAAEPTPKELAKAVQFLMDQLPDSMRHVGQLIVLSPSPAQKGVPVELKAPAADYPPFLIDLKSRIQAARIAAARAVNRDLILLYWDIGQAIVAKQAQAGWGESVIDRLSRDLCTAFPGMTGFSPRNLRDMKRFYLTYGAPESGLRPGLKSRRSGHAASDGSIRRQPVAELETPEFWRQAVAKIPWGHHLLILNKIETTDARLYYMNATAQLGWSRNVLLNQIKARAYERTLGEGKKHNFPAVLPESIDKQAEEALKSSYSLGFLGVGREIKERDLEDRLIERLRDFMLELGYGFCFMGRQHRLALGDKEYFIDLLFYHRFLKALVAIELKVGEFEPEHAGKMDFYLNLLNEKERAPDDKPSIGIILCAEKDDVEVEFALKSKTNPIGVASYHLETKLPTDLRGRLPTAKQLSEVVRAVMPPKK